MNVNCVGHVTTTITTTNTNTTNTYTIAAGATTATTTITTTDQVTDKLLKHVCSLFYILRRSLQANQILLFSKLYVHLQTMTVIRSKQ